jgi:hypothetical protein
LAAQSGVGRPVGTGDGGAPGDVGVTGLGAGAAGLPGSDGPAGALAGSAWTAAAASGSNTQSLALEMAWPSGAVRRSSAVSARL